MKDKRHSLLNSWISSTLSEPVLDVRLHSADASFRRYFRVFLPDSTLVAMDADPQKESSQEFVAIAKLLVQQGVNVPEIIAADLDQGFLLLSDFGDQLLLDTVNANNCNEYYQRAMSDLLHMQQLSGQALAGIPPYSAALLLDECQRFDQWYLACHLGKELGDDDKAIIQGCYQQLIESAIQQPQVFVHRDYHSRNIMVLPEKRLGIIDFQDAVCGPITYDLVSLLRDCYIDWPIEQVQQWLAEYYQSLQQAGMADDYDLQQFIRWFDLMGMQRHLKAIAHFARLLHRDNKPNYIQYIPRSLNYVQQVCGRYDELKDFSELLHNTVTS